MFHFLSETLESYYCQKLLSISNNRFDTYIALRYQGLHATTIPKDNIAVTENKNVFTVQSKTERGVFYTVDMTVGVCTCPQGIDGSPCSHQAAVAIHYDKASINCIPTLAPPICQIYATIVLGEKADKNQAFYASLHEKTPASNVEVDMFDPNYSSQSMHLLQIIVEPDDSDDKVSTGLSLNNLKSRIQAVHSAIDKIAEDLKQKLEEKNEQLLFGVEKFSSRYESLKGSIPLLTSSLYCALGGHLVDPLQAGKVTTCAMEGEFQCKQQVLEERVLSFKSRGKAQVTPGAPVKALSGIDTKSNNLDSRYLIPTRIQKVRRPHSLMYNIKRGQQNAGKW